MEENTYVGITLIRGFYVNDTKLAYMCRQHKKPHVKLSSVNRLYRQPSSISISSWFKCQWNEWWELYSRTTCDMFSQDCWVVLRGHSVVTGCDSALCGKIPFLSWSVLCKHDHKLSLSLSLHFRVTMVTTAPVDSELTTLVFMSTALYLVRSSTG